MFALTVREWLEKATYKNYLTLILVRQCRWRKMMYSHLEEMLEQKKQSLLKYREKSLFEEIEWQKKVKELYIQIKKWLEPLQKRNYLVFKEEKRSVGTSVVNEEDFKPAMRDFLTIPFFNGETIEFEPVGFNVVGAYGRVNLQLGLREMMIVLKEPDGEWEFAERNEGRKLIFYPFNQDTFEQLVTEFVESF